MKQMDCQGKVGPMQAFLKIFDAGGRRSAHPYIQRVLKAICPHVPPALKF